MIIQCQYLVITDKKVALMVSQTDQCLLAFENKAYKDRDGGVDNEDENREEREDSDRMLVMKMIKKKKEMMMKMKKKKKK